MDHSFLAAADDLDKVLDDFEKNEGEHILEFSIGKVHVTQQFCSAFTHEQVSFVPRFLSEHELPHRVYHIVMNHAFRGRNHSPYDVSWNYPKNVSHFTYM